MRTIVAESTANRPAEAIRAVWKRYPVGLSAHTIEQGVIRATQALPHLRLGQWAGMILGAALSVVTLLAYFFFVRPTWVAQGLLPGTQLWWAQPLDPYLSHHASEHGRDAAAFGVVALGIPLLVNPVLRVWNMIRLWRLAGLRGGWRYRNPRPVSGYWRVALGVAAALAFLFLLAPTGMRMTAAALRHTLPGRVAGWLNLEDRLIATALPATRPTASAQPSDYELAETRMRDALQQLESVRRGSAFQRLQTEQNQWWARFRRIGDAKTRLRLLEQRAQELEQQLARERFRPRSR